MNHNECDIWRHGMFCSKCGKKILDGDVFCPGCGTKIEWARFIEPEPFEEKFEQPEPEIPKVKETFDFNWDLDDFTRKKIEDVKIEWGDLLGTEEKKDAAEKKEDIIESPFADVDLNQRKASEPEPEQVKEEEPEMEEGLEFFQREMKFDTFNRKNQEFQDLLDKERDRVRKNAEANAMMAEEIDSWAEKKEVELEEPETVPEEIEIPDVIGEPEDVQEEIAEEVSEPVPEVEEVPEIAEEEEVPEPEAEEETSEAAEEEEAPAEESVPEEEPEKEPEVIPVAAPVPEKKLSFFERRRRKRAEKQAMYDAPAAPAEPEEPLKMDEDDIGGEWTEPEEAAEAPEVPEIDITPVGEPEENVIEDMLAADAAVAPERKKSMTQKISRDEFSDFLKGIEAQFGIDELDVAVAEPEEMPEEPTLLELEEEAEDILEEPAEEVEVFPEIVEEAEEVPEVIEEEVLPEITEEPEEIPEPAVEEVLEAEPEAVAEPEPVVEETVAVEDITEIEPASSVKKKEDTGEFKLGDFKDDSFWDDEKDNSGDASGSSKKGSGFGTFLIVLLALVLLAEIAILVIRFQFPDTGIAHTIEPVLTHVEQWIRGLFT